MGAESPKGLATSSRTPSSGFGDEAHAIATQGGRVFAAGRGATDFLVRAYDAQTGALLWQDGSGAVGSQLYAVATGARGVFAAGHTEHGGAVYLIRAYDAQ